MYKRQVYRLLKELQIPYERLDHEPMETMEACQDVDKLLHIHMCKNLFLCNSQKTVFYLLMMPGEKKFKTKELSKQIGSARLSFASEEYMVKFLKDVYKRQPLKRCAEGYLSTGIICILILFLIIWKPYGKTED